MATMFVLTYDAQKTYIDVASILFDICHVETPATFYQFEDVLRDLADKRTQHVGDVSLKRTTKLFQETFGKVFFKKCRTNIFLKIVDVKTAFLALRRLLECTLYDPNSSEQDVWRMYEGLALIENFLATLTKFH